jgi:uncharacterized protein (UPF0332 family)
MKEQYQIILDKARESLAAARLLKEQGFLDFAASRAYYAMFYAAEALLLQRDLSFSSHAAVIAAYGKEYSKTNELPTKFHTYLIAAENFRSQGDYSFSSGVAKNNVQSALEWASEFLEAATVYLEGK